MSDISGYSVNRLITTAPPKSDHSIMNALL